jgi:hypothetical protein
MLVLGLIILIGAGVVGAVAVLDNRGAGHELPDGFHAFGRVLHGSSGQLFFWGSVVGAAAMLGLVLLLAGVRRDLQLRAQARRDGVRARRTRRVRTGKDGDTDADYDRDRDHGRERDGDRDRDGARDSDEDSRPASETTRERKSEPQPVPGESGDGADGDAGGKA